MNEYIQTLKYYAALKIQTHKHKYISKKVLGEKNLKKTCMITSI